MSQVAGKLSAILMSFNGSPDFNLSKIPIKQGTMTDAAYSQVQIALQLIHDSAHSACMSQDDRDVIETLLHKGNKKEATKMIMDSMQDFITVDSQTRTTNNQPLVVSNLIGRVGAKTLVGSVQVADWPAHSEFCIVINNHNQGIYNSHMMCHHTKKALRATFCLVICIRPKTKTSEKMEDDA